MNKKDVAGYINYSNLTSTVTKEDIAKMCEDATNYCFHSICVNPRYVEFAKYCLNELNSKVKLCAAVGYPLGENTQEIKAMEAVMLKDAGADELEIVISISSAVTANYEYIHEEIKRIVDCTEIPVKAIIEVSKLTDEQIVRSCEACIDAGVKFIKANTGLEENVLTQEKVKQVADLVAGVCELEVAGDIDNVNMLYDMVCAGATRVATNSAVKLIKSFNQSK